MSNSFARPARRSGQRQEIARVSPDNCLVPPPFPPRTRRSASAVEISGLRLHYFLSRSSIQFLLHFRIGVVRRKSCDLPCAGMGRTGSRCPPEPVMQKQGVGDVRTRGFPWCGRELYPRTQKHPIAPSRFRRRGDSPPYRLRTNTRFLPDDSIEAFSASSAVNSQSILGCRVLRSSHLAFGSRCIFPVFPPPHESALIHPSFCASPPFGLPKTPFRAILFPCPTPPPKPPPTPKAPSGGP